MGIFEDQIKDRRDADRQALEESFKMIAGAVLGQRNALRLSDDRIITKQAHYEVLKYYHLKTVDIPDNLKPQEQMDYCLRQYGMMRRDVELTDKWYHDSYGPLLGYLKESRIPVALLPNTFRGYHYIDPDTGEKVRINRRTAKRIESGAVCFYRPLPRKELGIPDLLRYMKDCVDLSDIVTIALASLAVSSVGLLIPRITAAVTGPVLAGGHKAALIGAGIFLFCVTVSENLMRVTNTLLTNRLRLKTSINVESSLMIRLMNLPVSFFRKYSPGELAGRSSSVNELCTALVEMVLSTGLTSFCSLLYVTQIFRFAPSLVIPSILIILITLIFSLVTTYAQIGLIRKRREVSVKLSGLSYALISGVQKIKLAGAERRVFARWLGNYSKEASLTYDPPMFIKINSVISNAISLFSTIVLYYIAAKSGVDQSSYFAFTAAYGALSGSFMTLTTVASTAAQIRPILEMAEPFLKTVPESSENREIVTSISGSVELDNVSFRYDEELPYVIKDLSLKIKKGDYVAIVGRTGCGKSTLVRLLLGFEKPEKGSVYYDGKDIDTLDLGSLRRNIGTVTQDGGLFQGDIYSNITITAPWLTLDEAWEAAETAGIADDIRKMPMGMHTVISEGQGGVSGGQKQRLMIARAIAPKPKLLIFDEATSALDNLTQKQVSESLDSMGCTRIVVAHRLSTIRHCDRIMVLDDGMIIEDGTYDELIAKGGYFAELVERQRVDN